MNEYMLKMKLIRRYEKISILLVAIVFSVIASVRILVPVLEKVQESSNVQEKVTLRVTKKSAMIQRTKDNFDSKPPRVEKETFIHYVNAIREWGEGLDED